MACRVKNNGHGHLAFRIYSPALPPDGAWEGTDLADTPDNRKLAEAQAVLISREIKKGTFDYLKWFPNGNKAHLFRPQEQADKDLTVGEYFRLWIESKKPPTVRAGLERDYREHFNRYILPQFENVNLKDVSPRKLLDFRLHLTEKRGLKLKSARTIIDATFRAMMRDARKIDGLISSDPFAALDWPRLPTTRPDPFSVEERNAVLQQFRAKTPFYYPFVYTLFFTGMRPSEALALRWGDVDLKAVFVSITKSRYMGDNGTKTPGSDREIKLMSELVEILGDFKPLHVTESSYVFLNQEGALLNFHTWRGGVWYRVLRSCDVRPRKPYSCRSTFISVGLSNGVNIKWLADYCGTWVAMIEKHYGKYIRNDVDEQLERLLGAAKTEIATETFQDEPSNYAKDVGGPTWIRTRDQPVMSRWL